VNKYLHTVASVGFLFTLNYDARNHELKKKNSVNTLWCTQMVKYGLKSINANIKKSHIQYANKL